jgi:hypothetical protein
MLASRSVNAAAGMPGIASPSGTSSISGLPLRRAGGRGGWGGVARGALPASGDAWKPRQPPHAERASRRRQLQGCPTAYRHHGLARADGGVGQWQPTAPFTRRGFQPTAGTAPTSMPRTNSRRAFNRAPHATAVGHASARERRPAADVEALAAGGRRRWCRRRRSCARGEQQRERGPPKACR